MVSQAGHTPRPALSLATLLTGVLIAALCGEAHAGICIVPDAGGTAQMPPECTDGYVSPEEAHMIIDGAPPGSTIIIDATHREFQLTNSGPGGSFPGGEFEQFNSILCMQMTGTGDLAGFNREICMPIQCETHIGPRTPGDPVQSFPTDMFLLQGQLFGDPDFDLLQITGGTGNGLPSPGHTTLRQDGTQWQVGSFFDIAYQIEFVGAPGSVLDGFGGITQDTIRMQAGVPGTTVQPGNDKWVTIQPTNIIFGSDTVPPIPADFFNPGSDPFTGTVPLKGLAIDPSDSNVDTIVRRLEPAVLDNVGDSQTIPIELVELQLTSVAPIEVTVGGAVDSFFDIYFDIEPSDPPSPGQMTITRTSNEGGTFTSSIDVTGRLTFVEHGTLGPVLELPIPTMTLVSTAPHNWTYEPIEGSVPDTGPNFYPERVPLTEEHPDGAVHTVLPGNKTFQMEFSIDIGSDTELSDPNADGDEGFDPGDVYVWIGPPVTPPTLPPCGRDGFKDDINLFTFGLDPPPDSPNCGTAAQVGTCPLPCDPAVCPAGSEYMNFLDVDGHDQLDRLLSNFIPPGGLSSPVPQSLLDAACIFDPRFLAISFDDDRATGWVAGDVPVTFPSPAGVSSYGESTTLDEVLSVSLGAGPPFPIAGLGPFDQESGIHVSLAPSPDAGEQDDDDVDSLDIVPRVGDISDPDAPCPYYYFSPDHEAHFGLDPGSIYERVAATGNIQVVDDVTHLGISEDADIDAFEFVWLVDPAGIASLGVLFSVDEDDPCTTIDESGGLMPSMIYASFLTGSSFPALVDPLPDDVDAITVWCEPVEPAPRGACCIPVPGATPDCLETTSGDCAIRGGTYQGDGTTCTDGNGNGVADLCERCEPVPGTLSCTQVTCPIAGQTCVPVRIQVDPLTGAVTALACDCVDECYVDFDFNNGVPFCVNPTCPLADQTCDLIGSDFDGDGIDEVFECECLPSATGACCDSNGNCFVTTSTDCQAQGGVYQGDGTACGGVEACCLPDNSCIMADALCCTNVFGGVPEFGATCGGAPEACCLPDGTCVMADPLCCELELGGVPEGPGTACSATPLKCCLPDGTCDFRDPLCCEDAGGVVSSSPNCDTPTGCCLPDGRCIDTDPECCQLFGGTPKATVCGPAEACCLPAGSTLGFLECLETDRECCLDVGGTPQGAGSVCSGVDSDGNGRDDVCDQQCTDPCDPVCDDGDVCTCNQCDTATGSCSNPQRLYGDVDCNNALNLFDIFCLLDAIGGVFNCCASNMDLEPCAGNNTLNILDVFAILDAIAGINACNCSAGPAPASSANRDAVSLRHVQRGEAPDPTRPAVIHLVPTVTDLRAGMPLTVDVYVSGAADLRGYEVKVRPVGGRGGALVFEDAEVRTDRKDYVFKGLGGLHAVDPLGGRIVGVLPEGSVSSGGHTYLGSFTFSAVRSARGVFTFVVSIGEDTMLLNSTGDFIAAAPAGPIAVTVR